MHWEEARTLDALGGVLSGSEAAAVRRTAAALYEQLGATRPSAVSPA
jgi:hypothetical protein